MIIRVIFIGVLVIITSACDLFRADKCGTFVDNRTEKGTTSGNPLAPTIIYCDEVQNITQTGDVIDNEDKGNGGSAATITSSRVNIDGKTVYKIGPGSSFARASGNTDIVWCKFSSNCNGINRTESNVTSPPSIWISGRHAEFRRSGSDGSYVVFNVDGQVVRHSF